MTKKRTKEITADKILVTFLWWAKKSNKRIPTADKILVLKIIIASYNA